VSHIANPFVVVLDANVMYPFRTRDVLFTFAQQGLFRARFTDQIIDEWTGSLIRNKPALEESIKKQATAVREVFEECFVTGYEAMIEGLELPDPNDRHVLAAAIKCSAQLIVTENLKDFPPKILEEHGIEALGADDVLVNTFDLFPLECARALRTVRKRYDNPSFSQSEFLLDLTKSGMPKLAAMARSTIEYL